MTKRPPTKTRIKTKPKTRLPAPVRGVRPSQPLSARSLSRIFLQPSLLYFNAVATHLSMREAARRLNVASSAITRQVNQLEQGLGVELFQREGRRLKLAPAGESLFRHTQRLDTTLEAAVADLALLRGLKTGIVRIATVESVGLSLLPDLLAEFGARFPRLHLDVSVVSSAEVVARIVDQRADLGFSFLAKPTKEVDVAIRRDVEIGVVMHPTHPLVEASSLTIAACLDHPFVVAKPEISIREVVEPFMHRTSLTLPPFIEVDSIRMLVELALTGRYVSIMTPIGVQKELESGALVFRPLEDEGLPRNRFGIIIKAGARLGFAPAAFFDFARESFETAQLPGSAK